MNTVAGEQFKAITVSDVQGNISAFTHSCAIKQKALKLLNVPL